MADNNTLLTIRKQVKKSKPDFIRSDANKKKRLGTGWRRPKGIDSKVRLGLRGFRKKVTKGYKSPAAVKGLSRQGLVMKMAYRTQDLDGLVPAKDCIIIGSGVGLKKKLDIVKAAADKKITIQNVKDPAAYLKEQEAKMDKKKQDKKKTAALKDKKNKEKEDKAGKKKSEEKAKEDKTLDSIAGEKPEDKAEERISKKEEEKKEKDKVLIKKTG